VTASELEKSFSFDKTVGIIGRARFQIFIANRLMRYTFPSYGIYTVSPKMSLLCLAITLIYVNRF